MTLPFRRLLLGILLLCTILFGAKLALDAHFRQDILLLIGGGGVLGFFIFSVVYNIFIIPFPYDVFLAATPWLYADQELAVFIASLLAMPTAAALAYGGGRGLTNHAQRWLQNVKSFPKALSYLQRYGAYAIAFSAVTPLPFSVVSWACGMARTPFWPFLLTAFITRGLRNFLVWWAVV